MAIERRDGIVGRELWSTDGTSAGTFNVFLAPSATPVGGPTDPDEAERIEWLSWEAIRSEIRAGRIRDGLSLTGLLYRLAEM